MTREIHLPLVSYILLAFVFLRSWFASVAHIRLTHCEETNSQESSTEAAVEKR